jgi:hypothetical protein
VEFVKPRKSKPKSKPIPVEPIAVEPIAVAAEEPIAVEPIAVEPIAVEPEEEFKQPEADLSDTEEMESFSEDDDLSAGGASPIRGAPLRRTPPGITGTNSTPRVCTEMMNLSSKIQPIKKNPGFADLPIVKEEYHSFECSFCGVVQGTKVPGEEEGHNSITKCQNWHCGADAPINFGDEYDFEHWGPSCVKNGVLKWLFPFNKRNCPNNEHITQLDSFWCLMTQCGKFCIEDLLLFTDSAK